MSDPVVGEKVLRDGAEVVVTEKNTKGAVKPPGDLHRLYWRVANGPQQMKFIDAFAKMEMANVHKAQDKDPQPEKTQAASELIDKVLADWQAGKRG
jgi:hypothetical protein